MEREDQLDIEFPIARNSDPVTSKKAGEAHAVKLPLRRTQCLMLVYWHPCQTAGELSRFWWKRYSWHNLSIRTVAETPHKRLPELEKLGYVRRSSDLRDCEDSGHTAYTWSLTAKGWGFAERNFRPLRNVRLRTLALEKGDCNV